MKKIGSLFLIGVLALTFSACTTLDKNEKVRVKCPACGYEFDLPTEGGH